METDPDKLHHFSFAPPFLMHQLILNQNIFEFHNLRDVDLDLDLDLDIRLPVQIVCQYNEITLMMKKNQYAFFSSHFLK